MTMQSLSEQMFHMLSDADGLWQKRVRKVNTASVFAALCAASLNKRGIRHVIDADGSAFTPQALCKARAKLPEGLLHDMHRSIQRPASPAPASAQSTAPRFTCTPAS